MKNIKVVAFDADDTLWVNEPYFRESEEQFCALMEDYLPRHSAARELFKIEIANLDVFGYGVKAFIISMIETALKISNKTIPTTVIEQLIKIGKSQLQKPIIILDGVEKVLQELHGKYKLVMATKGDLKEQEGKLLRSGLDVYFHHIEIVSEKTSNEYRKLIKHLDIQPTEFLMIGNSLKSDIFPVIEIGGHGCHIPYHTTWEHETIDVHQNTGSYLALENITELLDHL